MKLNQVPKLLLGIASIYPIIHMILVPIFYVFVNVPYYTGSKDSEPFKTLIPISDSVMDLVPIAFFTMLALEVLFIVHVFAFKRDCTNLMTRITWSAGLIMLGMVTVPVYWYMQIWCSNLKDKEMQQNQNIGSQKYECPQCTRNVTDIDRFCPYCGYPLSSGN